MRKNTSGSLFRSTWVRAQSCPTHRNPVDCSPPGSLSMGLSRQEYWSELPFPSPRDVPHPGVESQPPASPALLEDSFR